MLFSGLQKTAYMLHSSVGPRLQASPTTNPPTSSTHYTSLLGWKEQVDEQQQQQLGGSCWACCQADNCQQRCRHVSVI